MVLAAVEAGKHVLCEKPMAPTLEECDAIIKATRKAGVKFMIAENHRFLPVHEYIANIVHQGLIGEVFLVRAYEGVNEIPRLIDEKSWKGDPIKAGGGALMDMAPHKFATLEWILNDDVDMAYIWLLKQCVKLDSRAEDNANILLKYKKGTVVNITLSFTVLSPPTNSMEIYGTNGTILENHEWEQPVRIFSNDNRMGENKGKWVIPKIEHGIFPKYYEISARREDDHFTKCIMNDMKPTFTPEQARKAIENSLLCYLSAEKRKPVKKSEFFKFCEENGFRVIIEKLKDEINEIIKN